MKLQNTTTKQPTQEFSLPALRHSLQQMANAYQCDYVDILDALRIEMVEMAESRLDTQSGTENNESKSMIGNMDNALYDCVGMARWLTHVHLLNNHPS